MEFQQILGFYHIARLKSFTRAAEATYRSQSALSQQVKALEQELECRLFEKAGKSVLRLTKEGELFFRFAEDVIRKQDQIVEKIKKTKGKRIGSITIAAPFNSMAYLLPANIERFSKEYPGIAIKLFEKSPFKSLEMVASGEADCAVTMRSAVPKKLTAYNWKKAEYVLILKKDHLLTKQSTITLEDIAQLPLILPLRDSKSSPRIKLLKKLDEMGLDVNIAMEAGGYFMIQNYVKRGFGAGFCLLPSEVIRQGDPELKIIPFHDHFGYENIAIALRKDKYMSEPLQAFVDFFLQDADE